MEVNVAAVDPFRPDTELYNSKILTFELPILQEEIRVEPRQIKMNKRTSTATLRVISNREPKTELIIKKDGLKETSGHDIIEHSVRQGEGQSYIIEMKVAFRKGIKMQNFEAEFRVSDPLEPTKVYQHIPISFTTDDTIIGKSMPS